MEASLEVFVELPYATNVVPDQTTEGSVCYVASHPELPGCMSHGDTPEEAMSNLSEAKKLYIKTLLKKGESVPLPRSSTVAIWQIAGAEVTVSPEEPYLIVSEVSPIEPLEQNREEITTT